MELILSIHQKFVCTGDLVSHAKAEGKICLLFSMPISLANFCVVFEMNTGLNFAEIWQALLTVLLLEKSPQLYSPYTVDIEQSIK